MSPKHQVPLEDLHAGRYVDGALYERVDISFAQRADQTWTAYIEARKALPRGPIAQSIEHGHWRWEKKVQATSRLLSYPTLGIEYDGQVQGLMMLCTDGFTTRCPGAALPVVYVPFLASAPWNLPGITEKPRFRGVGTVLMRAAVEISMDLGFKGRIALHSLPQANAWYERLGMANFGPDAEKQNLNYYEMTAEGAVAFIREENA